MEPPRDALQDTTGPLASYLDALYFRGGSSRPLLLSFAHNFRMSTLELFHTLALIERFYCQPVGKEFVVGTMLAIFQISHKLLNDHVVCAEAVADMVMVEGVAPRHGLGVGVLRCYEEHVFSRLLRLPGNALMVSLEQTVATGRWLYELSAGPVRFEPCGPQARVEPLRYSSDDGCVWVLGAEASGAPEECALGRPEQLEQSEPDRDARLKPPPSPCKAPCGLLRAARLPLAGRWGPTLAPHARYFARLHERGLAFALGRELGPRGSPAWARSRSKSPRLLRALSSPSLLHYVCPSGCPTDGFGQTLSAC